MIFADRIEAGAKLAAALAGRGRERPIVYALPRGGVPLAACVAAALKAPLDLVLVRKIGVPRQPELAMGAVVDGAEPAVVRNEDVIARAGVSEAEFSDALARQLVEIARRRKRYFGERARADVRGRVAIVVDDGVATGATMRAALRGLRKQGAAKLIVATPVAPPDVVEQLRAEADEVVCLDSPPAFGSVGAYYRDFRQVGDDEVIATLAARSSDVAGPEI